MQFRQAAGRSLPIPGPARQFRRRRVQRESATKLSTGKPVEYWPPAGASVGSKGKKSFRTEPELSDAPVQPWRQQPAKKKQPDIESTCRESGRTLYARENAPRVGKGSPCRSAEPIATGRRRAVQP